MLFSRPNKYPAVKALLALSSALLTLAACTNDDAPGLSDLLDATRWVEAIERRDTLSFERLGDEEVVQLGRGRELRDGHDKPRPNSGPYYYDITGGRIALRWIASSDSRSREYPFEVEGKTLSIGNFYGSDLGEILSFERLE